MIKNIIEVATTVKKYFLPTKYDIVQKELYNSRVKFYSQFIQPGDMCFDIGANFGNRTSVFLALGAKVVALEPQEKCIKYLQKKFGTKAIFLQKGAGEKNEIKDFYISEKYDQLSSFAKDWISNLKDRIGEIKIDTVEKIEIVTLDSLVQTYGKPTFVKIDVEGFELEVLKGLKKEFKYLSFEYAVPEMLENLLECLQIINKNYKDATFNYSIGEQNILQHKEWLKLNDLMNLIKNPKFSESYAGDIYVKY